MQIIKMFPEQLSNEQKYQLIRSPKIGKMSDVKGQRLQVTAYMLREDAKQDGEVQLICSILTADGDMYATNSSTFIREFEAIIECVGDQPFALDVLDGVSRNGRHFVTCAWGI